MQNFLKNNIVLISIGAIPGALIRWHIDSTFIANLIGCFLLGFINHWVISRRYKLIFGFSFCGSMTTFSGWSLYLYNLIDQGLYRLFLLHSILFVILGIFATSLGYVFAKKLSP